mmetsp:Transcript_46602/g.122354  ORF Transcript_46602/g.122354 Transcript_46602/m.122354 type:complete len:226 (-) Transcript_46602:744-1421(-)
MLTGVDRVQYRIVHTCLSLVSRGTRIQVHHRHVARIPNWRTGRRKFTKLQATCKNPSSIVLIPLCSLQSALCVLKSQMDVDALRHDSQVLRTGSLDVPHAEYGARASALQLQAVQVATAYSAGTDAPDMNLTERSLAHRSAHHWCAALVSALRRVADTCIKRPWATRASESPRKRWAPGGERRGSAATVQLLLERRPPLLCLHGSPNFSMPQRLPCCSTQTTWSA